ncbi:hypothetical protein PIB30_069844 [Stylosanthes scabra]|uniref:Uncharacterized protein n=1 Tax=Stylosanthes scabra TaxID=79078 RepID=A0ABU6QNQ4_9FABA|nr:hypothetical protein [Stylosanthes scabra]
MEGKHSGDAWRMMEDSVWGYPCATRESFRVVVIGPVVTDAVDNIQHLLMGGNGCCTLRNKEELAERSGNEMRWTTLTLVDPAQFHPNSRSKVLMDEEPAQSMNGILIGYVCPLQIMDSSHFG